MPCSINSKGEVSIVVETQDTYQKPAHGWTCFHCGETFTTAGGARDHFGGNHNTKPGCMIRVQLGNERGLQMALRKAETSLRTIANMTAVLQQENLRELLTQVNVEAHKGLGGEGEHYEPKGLKFYDKASARYMILVEQGPYRGWICYKHPDSQWVTLREATEEDKKMQMAATGVPR